MQGRFDSFAMPPNPAGSCDPELRALIESVDLSEALADFPHKGFAMGDDGQWYSVGRGKRVPLGSYDPNLGMAELRRLAGES